MLASGGGQRKKDLSNLEYVDVRFILPTLDMCEVWLPRVKTLSEEIHVSS